MVNSIEEARSVYEQKVGRRKLYKELAKDLEEKISKLKISLETSLKARTVIQIVAKNTQKKIELHISNLVTMSLSSVFPEPYEFQLRFTERRNTTEADLIFKKNGNEFDDILESGGGGVADVANLALIISLWTLHKTRPTFIMDEPDKFIHNPQYQERTSNMIKRLCEIAGIQVIIVSDQPNIISSADKVIRVGIKNGTSFIKESENNG